MSGQVPPQLIAQPVQFIPRAASHWQQLVPAIRAESVSRSHLLKRALCGCAVQACMEDGLTVRAAALDAAVNMRMQAATRQPSLEVFHLCSLDENAGVDGLFYFVRTVPPLASASSACRCSSWLMNLGSRPNILVS